MNEALTNGKIGRRGGDGRYSGFELGSKTALLTSNRVMTKRLDHLLHQNAIWSKAVNPFQLTFSPHDSKNIRSTITSLGVLVQNGKRKFTPTNRSVFSQGKIRHP